MTTLPTAVDAVAEAERLGLAPEVRQAGFERMSANHRAAARAIPAEGRKASDTRRAQFHVDQAELLLRESETYAVNFDQVVEAQEPRSPEGANDHRDDTRRAADQVLADGDKRGWIPTRAGERIDALMNEDARVTRLTAATGDKHFLDAWRKVTVDPTRGHLMWSNQERDAWQRAQNAHNEFRSMSEGVGSGGGFAVPIHLQPSVLLSNNGCTTPLRDVSRVETISTDVWNGLTSEGVTSEWLGEGLESTLSDPVFVQPSIPVFKNSCYVEWSYELGADAPALIDQLSTLIADEIAIRTETAYTTGTGIGQPTGIISALDGSSSEVLQAAGEAITAADVYALQAALPPRFRPNASWLANLSILHILDQFETTNGAPRFRDELAQGNLLRRPIREASLMDSGYSAAATADNFVLLIADFAKAFVIVDHVAGGYEPLPVVIGTNRRPTGKRGLQFWHRTGSNVVVANAARLLNVATVA